MLNCLCANTIGSNISHLKQVSQLELKCPYVLSHDLAGQRLDCCRCRLGINDGPQPQVEGVSRNHRLLHGMGAKVRGSDKHTI